MSILNSQTTQYNTVDAKGFPYDIEDVYINYPKIDKLYGYEAELANGNKAAPKMQHSIQVLLTKDHLIKLENAINAHAKVGNLPPLQNLSQVAIHDNKSLIRDGETVADLDVRYQGTYRKTVATTFDITVKRWEKGRQIILSQEQIAAEVYGGCRCVIGVQIKYYNNGSKSGYAFYLKGVIKIAEGEPFPVSVSADYGSGLDLSKYAGTTSVVKQSGEVAVPASSILEEGEDDKGVVSGILS